MTRSQGYVLYEGPSLFNNEPVTVVATGFKKRSGNIKTGELIQIFILGQEAQPSHLHAKGKDKIVCNDCKHSKNFGNSCYVELVRHGVNGVYRAWKNGTYPDLDMDAFRGESVRFGAYGDPTAVPYEVWEPIVDKLKNTNGLWTGFTHSWRTCDPRFKNFLVASVDTPEERIEAINAGWRTFRTMLEDEQPGKGEFMCPATDEMFEKTGRKIQCIDCGACNGLADKSNRRGSACIRVHGVKRKVENYVNLRVLIQSEKKIAA